MKRDAWSMFIMDLASYLHKSVEEILLLSSSELTRWMVYFKVKKLVGEDRQDYRNAMTCLTIATTMGGSKYKGKITDFIPFYERLMPTFNSLVDKLKSWVSTSSKQKPKTTSKKEKSK